MSEAPTIKLHAESDTNTEKSAGLITTWKKRRESMASQNSSVGPPSGAPLMRRRSTMRSITLGILGMRRMTLTKKSDVSDRPLIRMENTYKTAPDTGTVFSVQRVSEAAQQILEAELDNRQYNQSECSRLACDLSIKIKTKVKEMDFKRYKIVCNVVMGQVANQGFEAASRCIWDSKSDNFACVPYKNNSLFAVAMVHGCYYE